MNFDLMRGDCLELMEGLPDNCMGSGTTGVACANTGRRFIGMEMDAGYFEIARGRIEAARLEAEARNDNLRAGEAVA